MERLFGHHTILLNRVLRGKIDREPQYVLAAQRMLRRNTRELAAVVRSLYGASAATSFTKVWNERVTALTAYSVALATRDDAAATKAASRLKRYPSRYGRAIEELTEGALPAAAATTSMSEHIGALLQASDAYAVPDFPTAYRYGRTAYAAMFDNGTMFAQAAVARTSGTVPDDFDGRAARLRSGLGWLLGEHSDLVFETTRAVVSTRPEAAAAADALNQNTADLLRALGRSPGSRFGNGWARSIDGIVRFAVAVADHDPVAQSRARAALYGVPQKVGVAVAGLIDGKVAARRVASALQLHNDEILKQATASAAGDVNAAHASAYAQYDHMFTFAQTLADVLEGYTSARAPRGGAATGGGSALR